MVLHFVTRLIPTHVDTRGAPRETSEGDVGEYGQPNKIVSR